MLKVLGTVARILFGLLLASLAAGLVTVLFVDLDVLIGPLDRLPKTLAATLDLALLAATHIAIFSFVFVLITSAIGEWFSIRAMSFYLVVGIAIAALGFTAQYASEVAGQATILNNYAIKAFLTVGFVGGFVYWLAAGQFAGRRPEPQPALATTSATDDVGPAPKKDEDVSVIITRPPAVATRPLWRMPKLERLKFAKRDGPDANPPDDPPADATDQDNSRIRD